MKSQIASKRNNVICLNVPLTELSYGGWRLFFLELKKLFSKKKSEAASPVLAITEDPVDDEEIYLTPSQRDRHILNTLSRGHIFYR